MKIKTYVFKNVVDDDIINDWIERDNVKVIDFELSQSSYTDLENKPQIKIAIVFRYKIKRSSRV